MITFEFKATEYNGMEGGFTVQRTLNISEPVDMGPKVFEALKEFFAKLGMRFVVPEETTDDSYSKTSKRSRHKQRKA